MPRRAPAALAGLALLGALPLTAAAQHVAATPPLERAFGPDHTSTGVFTGTGVTPAGLVCDAPADATTPLTCEGFLPSFDGTLLETTVRVPRSSGLHPLVVGMHGWGGSRNSMVRFDDTLLAAGFTFLRYSARGFGGSWGQTNLADVDVEGADLRALVGQVVDDARLAADPGAVAVFGASYGGAHAWLAALDPAFTSPGGKGVVVRTVVPIAGWSDLLEALVPNGRPEHAADVAGAEKLSFVQALFLGGIRTRLDRPYPNYPDYLVRWNVEMTTNELPYPATPTGREVVDGLQGYRSAYWQEPFWTRVGGTPAAEQLPIFAIQGFTDDLFPPREAVRMYDALKSIDPAYPIALYLGDLGHPRAANKTGELDYALKQVVAWLGWYLRGSGTQPRLDVQAAITRPATVPFTDADVIRVPTYAALSNATVSHRWSGWQVITFNPINLTGFQWDPLVLTACGELNPCPAAPAAVDVPGDEAVYEAPVSQFSSGGLLVAGEPQFSVWLLTSSPRVQLDVRVFDVAPDKTRSLVTRGTYTVDNGAPIRTMRVTLPTNGNLWEVPSGHTLRFEVTNVDFPYLRPSLVPSVSLLYGAEVSIPVRR
jgi:predicted acyl esterase